VAQTSFRPRTRPEPEAPAPEREYGPPESYRLRALLALAVAVLGVGAFVVGVGHAVRRIPADAEARAGARRDSALRARGAGATARPGQRGGGAQPEELPRLR
jgi:hypothetical protein